MHDSTPHAAKLAERARRQIDSGADISEAQLRGLRHSYTVVQPVERRAADRLASIRYVPHPAVAKHTREKAAKAKAAAVRVRDA